MPRRFSLAGLDGRWIALAILLAFAAALKLTSLAAERPVFELPPFAWFGPMPPYFADLRGMVSWSDQYTSDPARSGVLLDPWNRPMNYPHPWLHVHELGVNGENVMTAGYALGLLFLASSFSVLGPLDLFGGIVAGSFLTSYAVMFGLERANVDLLMFALLALALAARRWPPGAAFLIGVAAILKIHPLFAFGAMARPPWQRSLVWIAAGLTLFGVVTLSHAHEFFAGLNTAPNMRTGDHSFGVTALALQLFPYAHEARFYPAVFAAGVALYIFVVGAAVHLRPVIPIGLADERSLFAFQLGAGIYLGTYLLGTNHDYRAACLVFCLPLLLSLFRRGAFPRWSFWTLLLLISVNWLAIGDDGPPVSSLAKQAISWMLLFCMAALYAATLPQEVQGPRMRTAQTGCDQPASATVSPT